MEYFDEIKFKSPFLLWAVVVQILHHILLCIIDSSIPTVSVTPISRVQNFGVQLCGLNSSASQVINFSLTKGSLSECQGKDANSSILSTARPYFVLGVLC